MQKAKKPQLRKFKEMARDLKCDEDEDRFEAKLKKIVRHTPEKKKPAKD